MTRTLDFGPCRLAWRLDETDGRWREFLSAYAGYWSAGSGQVVVEAEVARPDAGATSPRLVNSLIRTRNLAGPDFELGDGLVRGRRAESDRIECILHPVLLTGCGLRVLEQFLYLLFYHAALAAAPREAEAPFLLHSSGVLHDDRAYLFCGPAGSGKSTAASLCPTRPLLSDEALVLQTGSDGFVVSGSPINPFCRDKTPGRGALARLCLIEHGQEHALLALPRQRAVPRLTAEIIAPLGLFEGELNRALARALERALRLHATGRVCRLAFRRDPGFWDLLRADPAGPDRADR